MVYSKDRRRSETIRSPDQAREEQPRQCSFPAAAGYYVTGAMSETELQTLHVGDTVTVMSWQTYSRHRGGDRQYFRIPGRGEDGNYYH